MPDAWRDAPPPTPVDGLLAVPVHVTALRARLDLDAAAGTGTGEAEVDLVTGPEDGHLVLDLRQTLTSVELDGTSLPVAAFAHHDLGGGPGAEMRVLDRLLSAGTAHVLRLRWSLGPPQSAAGGSYPPALVFSSGTRVRLSFGFTDLRAARYLEAWLPANLLFDAHPVRLELRITGTAIAHTVITNAATTVLAPRHWRLDWPPSTTAASTMLEVRPADTVTSVNLPVALAATGQTVTVEAWKLVADTGLDLSAQAALIGSYLAANAAEIGPYGHGDRFVAFFVGGGMEYDGATTTGTGPLRHEVHHSWWGRKWRPASQADGWLDEGWTTWVDGGASSSVPFDFTDPPVLLRPAAPWSRVTVGNAYGDGSAFFSGLASLLGVAELRTAMRAFWAAEQAQPSTTVRLEEFLVRRTGDPRVVDAFSRFAYGHTDTAADLWLRDDPADSGLQPWAGRFWDSPDLWCRNADDGGTTSQPPEAGQDNFLYARVRNRSTAAVARHCVVTFRVAPWTGTQFTFPSDWLPPMAAVAAFDIGPGQERVVRARWPSALVPPAGRHVCWLAAVLSRSDTPTSGAQTWQANGLAQKNLVVVDLAPDTWWVLPFVAGRWGKAAVRKPLALELVRPAGSEKVEAVLLHSSGRALVASRRTPLPSGLLEALRAVPGRERLPAPVREALPVPLAESAPREPAALAWPVGPRAELTLRGSRSTGQLDLALAVRAPAKAGEVALDLVARQGTGGPVTGGLAVRLRVAPRG